MAGSCRFWAQGNCRNGDNCRFEHGPVNSGYQGGGGGGNRGGNQGGYQNGNRFAPLQNQDQPRNNGSRPGSQPVQPPRGTRYELDKAAIIVDLSSERPQWPLSSYGPGRKAPAQMFGGPLREQSFEEMRLKHYIGIAAGNPQEAIREAEQMVQAAESQRQHALNDVDAAIEYIIGEERSHPNRLDIVRDTMSSAIQPNPFSSTPTQPSGAFGAPSQTPNPFDAPTVPSHSANAFGTPVFGAPSQSGAFGQSASFPQAPNPFGAPSAPAFGGPSQLGRGGGGAFGQPSALGQGANPFGAPSSSTATPAPFSALSQPPGAFVQPTTAPGVFGAPSQATAAPPFGSAQSSVSAFGVPSSSSASNTFGAASSTPFRAPSPSPRNPFGSATQPVVAPNPFGATPAPSQANPFGSASGAASSSQFGGPSQPNNAFGSTPAPLQPNPFSTAPTSSQPNPFGSAPSNASPFGAPSSNQAPIPSPFGQPNGPPASVNPLGGGGQSSMRNGVAADGHTRPYSAPASVNPPLSSYSTTDGTGRLTTFKGKRVVYRDDVPGILGADREWRVIIFPNGPPKFIEDAKVADDEYDDETRQAFEQLRLTGSFPNNQMPLLPPKGEWVRWDF